jgi:hypothetical protein
MSRRIAPGSKGHFWFLQVDIKYLEDQDTKITMMLGLSSLMDILPDAIDELALYPLDKSSTLPPLTNNKLEDGFPGSAVLAFKYFMVKDKRNRPGNQKTAALLSQPSLHRHNDEEDYKPPTSFGGVIWVTGNGNIKEACKALAWNMMDACLQVQWKDHHLADSSAQVLPLKCPPCSGPKRHLKQDHVALGRDKERFVEERVSPHGVNWSSSP